MLQCLNNLVILFIVGCQTLEVQHQRPWVLRGNGNEADYQTVRATKTTRNFWPRRNSLAKIFELVILASMHQFQVDDASSDPLVCSNRLRNEPLPNPCRSRSKWSWWMNLAWPRKLRKWVIRWVTLMSVLFFTEEFQRNYHFNLFLCIHPA